MRRSWWAWIAVSTAAVVIGVGLLLYYGRGIGCGDAGTWDGGSPEIGPCEERIRIAARMFWVGALLTVAGLVGIAAALGYRRGARHRAGAL